ncbi:MAG TPA: coenzyme A pyrophosphatase, partial [Micromonospora sp.]
SVSVLAQLPRLWIPVSEFVVTPVLGWWHSPHPVYPRDTAEVAHVARLPIAELVDPANRLRVRHPSGWTGPAFQVRGMLVWGFTAGVLSALLDMGGWTRPWDPRRVADLPPPPAPSAGPDDVDEMTGPLP